MVAQADSAVRLNAHTTPVIVSVAGGDIRTESQSHCMVVPGTSGDEPSRDNNENPDACGNSQHLIE
jgi:hypothetical protein